MNITACLFTVLGGMVTLGHPSETVRIYHSRCSHGQSGIFRQTRIYRFIRLVG